MNWSKLPKEKRKNLVLVVLVTLAILAGLGFGLIRPQYNSLKRLAGDKVKAEKQYQQMQAAVQHADQLVAELNWAKTALGTMEKDVASGDLYSWVISTLRAFKVPYQVDLPSFSPIGPRSPMSLIPNFPYEQASITVAGRAHFHDFGRFVADFENQFPHIRVLNLDLDLDTVSTQPEMLSFKMDIVTLVKPNPS